MNLSNYIIDWDKEKNVWLKNNRNISFEIIEVKLLEKDILDIVPNASSKFSHQFMLIVDIDDYIYLVPFVINKENMTIFFKTIIPSRKYTKQYLTHK